MTELNSFVREALSVGKTRSEICDALLLASWPSDEVDQAIAAYADVPFPVPIPRPRNSGSAREAFLYLVTFLMLYTASISLGNLITGYVDTIYPDPVQDPYDFGENFRHDAVRWLVASLIVSFPTWFFLTRSLLVSNAKHPERRASGVRKWLTYLTLFVAASCVLTTVICFLAGALGGEYVIRTVLKYSVVIVLSGGIFGFYLWDMRRDEGGTGLGHRPRGLTLLSILLWIVVIASTAGGLMNVGSPIQARKEKSDAQRVSDLSTLAHAIRVYYKNHKALPPTQDKAYGAADGSPVDPKDPETNERYGYRIVDKSHFELSSTFQTDQSQETRRRTYGELNATVPFIKHKEGPQKFVLDAKGGSGE